MGTIWGGGLEAGGCTCPWGDGRVDGLLGYDPAWVLD